MMSVAIGRIARRDSSKGCAVRYRRQSGHPDIELQAQGSGIHGDIVETYCEGSNEAVAATPDLITHVEVHKTGA